MEPKRNNLKSKEIGRVTGGVYHPPSWLVTDAEAPEAAAAATTTTHLKSGPKKKQKTIWGTALSVDPSVEAATPLSVYKYVVETWGPDAHNDVSKIFWSQVVRDVPGLYTQKDAKILYYRHILDGKNIDTAPVFRERGRVSGGVYQPPSWLVADEDDLKLATVTPLSVYNYVGETWGPDAHNQSWKIVWSQVVRDIKGISSQKEARSLYHRHFGIEESRTTDQSEHGRVSAGVYHPPSWLVLD
jgi:hypothetical protein